MKLTKEIEALLNGEVKRAVKETLEAKGLSPEQPKKLTEASKSSVAQLLTSAAKNAVKTLKEGFTLIPKSHMMKTEKLSDSAKTAHDKLYKGYVEAFNKVATGLIAADRGDVKATASSYRSLKVDETYNFNGVKLHELYFANISDVDSEIRVDSLPYMRLARDWGTFEAWQEDFMAACMASRNGWGITVWEPYRNVFMNVTVDSHDKDIPVGCVPVIVMDMWEHAYFKDYSLDKKAYLFAMMKELNWDVIEARIAVCEKSNLDLIYKIEPLTNPRPDAMLTAAAERAGTVPITQVQPPAEKAVTTGLGNQATTPLSPSAPAAPATQAPGVQTRG
jgi:Fe-Mn family superoxide dismutase